MYSAKSFLSSRMAGRPVGWGSPGESRVHAACLHVMCLRREVSQHGRHGILLGPVPPMLGMSVPH